MPGLSGTSLLPRLREAAPQAVIAYFSGQEVPPAERDQVDAVIAKPLNLADLERAVASLVRPRA